MKDNSQPIPLGDLRSSGFSRVARYALITLLCLSTAAPLPAQEREWWFEIEVLVFERDLATNDLQEVFAQQPTPLDTSGTHDLITPHINPDITHLRDGLKYCDAPPPSVDQTAGVFTPDAALSLPAREFPAIFAYVDAAGAVNRQQYDDTSLRDDTSTLSFDMGDEPESIPAVLSDFWAFYTDQANARKAEFSAEPIVLPDTLACVFRNEQLVLQHPFDTEHTPRLLSRVPRTLDGTEWKYWRAPYLLSESSLQFGQLAKDIRWQKGITKLLHLGWRQQVFFGRDNGKAMRLFAGQNYADRYDVEGQKLPDAITAMESIVEDELSTEISDITESDAAPMGFASVGETSPEPLNLNPASEFSTEPPQLSLVDQIRLALDDPTDSWRTITAPAPLETFSRAEELWQLDGRFKVFLRYIKGTPYLHIDSELDYRLPGKDSLNTYRFNQLRRVISTQMHYFDHPLFGMVVQIRRYQRPDRAQAESELAE